MGESNLAVHAAPYLGMAPPCSSWHIVPVRQRRVATFADAAGCTVKNWVDVSTGNGIHLGMTPSAWQHRFVDVKTISGLSI